MSLMLTYPFFKDFILIQECVHCFKIHMQSCMQTHVEMHTGDLRADLYQQTIDQCQGLLILIRLGVLPL